MIYYAFAMTFVVGLMFGAVGMNAFAVFLEGRKQMTDDRQMTEAVELVRQELGGTILNYERN